MGNDRLAILTMVAVMAGSILTVAVVTGLSIIEEGYALKQKNVGSGESNMSLEGGDGGVVSIRSLEGGDGVDGGDGGVA